MIDHIESDTEVFDSHSQASTPLPDFELNGENGNECEQFQDTVPLYDTLVLDSPSDETQLQKLDLDTQVVDGSGSFEDGGRLQSICEYEKEVVLDSEDEGGCRTNTLRDTNRLLYGSKGYRVVIKRTDEKKDPTIGSQEPGESSQANALEFVDRFLSFNKMELSPGDAINKAVREKSPPDSSRKGPQSLAKRMTFRKTSVKRNGTFEWADSHERGKDDVFCKNVDAPSECEALGHRSGMTGREAGHFSNRDRSCGNELEEKNQLVNMCKEMVGSRFVEHSPKEISRIEQVSKMDLGNDSVEELNKDLHAELSNQKLNYNDTESDLLDIFDVGFSTQIAAEAMETLAYGQFAGCSAFDSDQVPTNTSEDSSKITCMSCLKSASIQMSDLTNSGGVVTKSKQRKRTARRSGKNYGNEEPDRRLANTRKAKRGKPLVRDQFDCGNSRETNASSGRNSLGLIVQRQANGTAGRRTKECENSTSLLISVEHISLNKEEVEGKLKNTSIVVQESMQSLAGGKLKRTHDQSDQAEDGIIKYRRKRSRSVGIPNEVVCARGRWSESHSNASAEARNSKLSQKEQTFQEVTPISSIKLDIWSHPRRKRTLHKGNRYYIKSWKRAEENGNTACYYEEKKGKPQSVYSITPSLLSEKDLREHIDEPGPAVVISNSELANVSKRICPPGMSDINFLLSNNIAKINQKCGVRSNKNLKPPASEPATTISLKKSVNVESSSNVPSKYHKRTFSKNLPKPSLLKELIILGVSETIPDFSWKDLRRRRDMEHVRVLCSQHLDDDIIKQQKKISTRLGISIATCPVDATHFIADRFVRTRNMLEVIALGKPVVSHLWLESCGQVSCLLDEKNYILRDARKEKEIGFSMPVSLARANQLPLLKGQSLFITPNIKPHKEMITCLVKAVQGQVLEKIWLSAVNNQKIQDNLLIVSCEEDYAICVPYLEKGGAAYSSELLLDGIVKQKLKFQRYQLFKDHSQRNPIQRKQMVHSGGEVLRTVAEH